MHVLTCSPLITQSSGQAVITFALEALSIADRFATLLCVIVHRELQTESRQNTAERSYRTLSDLSEASAPNMYSWSFR